jgi:hypothetical protein
MQICCSNVPNIDAWLLPPLQLGVVAVAVMGLYGAATRCGTRPCMQIFIFIRARGANVHAWLLLLPLPGVVAVAVMGLYGAVTNWWDTSMHANNLFESA